MPELDAEALAPRTTRAPGPEARGWFVVYSKPRRENAAQFHLQHRGVEVFAPKVLLPEYLGRRTRLIPLFPNYLFVKIAPAEDFYRVLWAPGVSRFVTSQTGVPARLDDAVVTFLQERADTEGVLAARADLKVGQQVEVTKGPFDGLIGIITRPPDARGRVKVLMQLLNRQPVKMEMPAHLLKATWVV